jgi:hypothetical protein
MDLAVVGDLAKPDWRKSSYSTGGGSNCVEVATTSTLVIVRDSKQTDGAVLAFNPRAWRRFTVVFRG